MTPITLPDDPREALQCIGEYLRSRSTDIERGVYDPHDIDTPCEIIGFWQTKEWLDGLDEIIQEITRIQASECADDSKDEGALLLHLAELRPNPAPATVSALIMPMLKREASELGAYMGLQRIKIEEHQFATIASHLAVSAFHAAHVIAQNHSQLHSDDNFTRWISQPLN